MSHCKFEHPRHGHLGFLPRKRSRQIRGRARAFPKDDPSQKPHLTSFMVFKAGMTHIVRDVDRPGSKVNKKEVVEPVTILEAPPMAIVGIVGYRETPVGLKAIGTVWAHHTSEEFRRRFYKNWKHSAQLAFNRQKQFSRTKEGKIAETRTLTAFAKKATVIRVIAHTQLRKLRNHRVGVKKAHVQEIQINGGDIKAKLELAKSLLEKEVRVDTIFQQSEACDVCAVTKGHGTEGVVKRWGVACLPRKTHRGLRKVACIGAWHPARVMYTVARAGQKGYHHRTHLNKKIYQMGRSVSVEPNQGTTTFDLTAKTITPMGGFVGYGTVRNDYVMLKGSVAGPRRRVITLRRPMAPQTSRLLKEKIVLKFIDTSSKIGHGRFQTKKEKTHWFGPLKKDRIRREERLRKERLARIAEKRGVKTRSVEMPLSKKEEKPAPKKEEKPAPKKEEKPVPKKEEKAAPKKEEKATPKKEEKAAPKKEEKPAPSPKKEEEKVNVKEAEAIEKAAEKYDKNYQDRMRQMVAPTVESHAAPFIGFSLADNIRKGHLIVDGVYTEGPASQVGVDIDHELVAVNGHKATGIAHVRTLIAQECKAGHITPFTLKKKDGTEYEAQIWVMTSDKEYSGKPYYFDREAHTIHQSDRLKRSWKEEDVKAALK